MLLGRGLNANSNGLQRQYFPKESSFENVSEYEVEYAMKRINTRSRKTLGYKKPFEVFLNRNNKADKYIDEAVALAT
jgi:IS30 family transposase